MESAWAFVVAASLVAFMTDMSVPAIWAYMQDVGGKNTAAVFGWGNMWGNFGAATTPLLVPIVLEQWDRNGDWHAEVTQCASRLRRDNTTHFVC